MSDLRVRRNNVKGLPPFDLWATCPKCGYGKFQGVSKGDLGRDTTQWIAANHMPDGCDNEACSTCNAEHIRRTCQRCHFQWAERCIEATKP